MKTLSGFLDLYEYLKTLASELRQQQTPALAKIVESAVAQAPGVGDEFAGESRLALIRLLMQENGALTDQQRAEASDVLKQIDSALGPFPGDPRKGHKKRK